MASKSVEDGPVNAAAPDLETPSGKDVEYENFPVGSWLLPAHLRPHIAVYYRFARAADDIADNTGLEPDDKIARLDAFEDAVRGRNPTEAGCETAHQMRESLTDTGTDARRATDLLRAFKQDATKRRYASWDELVDYCMYSAAPVGQYLLDLHGGSTDGYEPSDALCIALQVINHLQDCQEDYREMDRVYVPEDMLAEAGARVEDLDRPHASPALRKVLDQMLDRTDALLTIADRLPAGLRSKRLAMESATIVNIAHALVARLRKQDPLAMRVALPKPVYIWCGVRGVASVLL
jgi:hydroxysqualene synthase